MRSREPVTIATDLRVFAPEEPQGSPTDLILCQAPKAMRPIAGPSCCVARGIDSSVDNVGAVFDDDLGDLLAAEATGHTDHEATAHGVDGSARGAPGRT